MLEADLAQIMEEEAAAIDRMQDDLKAAMMREDLAWLQEEQEAIDPEADEVVAEGEAATDASEVAPDRPEAAAPAEPQPEGPPPAPQSLPLPLPDAAAPAPDAPLDADAFQAALSELNWCDRSTPNRFYFHEIASGRRALVIFPLAGLKAVCESHRGCACWFSKLPAQRPDAMAALIKWGGEGPTTSKEQHQRSSQELKRAFGMRVKVPAAS